MFWQHPPMSAPDLPSDFEQAIALFRAQFAQSLPERMAEVHACLAACLAAPQEQAPLKDLHRVLHRLAGSAGTFGMPAFGDACRAIEARLESLMEQPERTLADYEDARRAIEGLEALRPAPAGASAGPSAPSG